jgi:hypothetical protein
MRKIRWFGGQILLTAFFLWVYQLQFFNAASLRRTLQQHRPDNLFLAPFFHDI